MTRIRRPLKIYHVLCSPDQLYFHLYFLRDTSPDPLASVMSHTFQLRNLFPFTAARTTEPRDRFWKLGRYRSLGTPMIFVETRNDPFFSSFHRRNLFLRERRVDVAQASEI